MQLSLHSRANRDIDVNQIYGNMSMKLSFDCLLRRLHVNVCMSESLSALTRLKWRHLFTLIHAHIHTGCQKLLSKAPGCKHIHTRNCLIDSRHVVSGRVCFEQRTFQLLDKPLYLLTCWQAPEQQPLSVYVYIIFINVLRMVPVFHSQWWKVAFYLYYTFFETSDKW